MREDAVSDKFFYRVIEIYCAAERDLLRDAFEGTKGRPPQSDSELDGWLATDERKTGHHGCARGSLDVRPNSDVGHKSSPHLPLA